MINLENFTAAERRQLEDIRMRVRLERPIIEKLREENVRLRRLVLELITCILHRRKPNEEAMKEIDLILRLDKLP